MSTRIGIVNIPKIVKVLDNIMDRQSQKPAFIGCISVAKDSKGKGENSSRGARSRGGDQRCRGPDLYHCTDALGYEVIRSSETIDSSRPGQRQMQNDLSLGHGSYLSTLPPHRPKHEILESNYGQETSSNARKADHHNIKVPKSAIQQYLDAGQKIVKHPQRDVWCIKDKTDQALDRTYGYGK